VKRIAALLLALPLALAGCGTTDPLQANRAQSDSVVVGSADFPESELLMDIYAEALRSTGTDVRTEGRIGAREIFVRATRSGELAVVPDYSGNLLRYLDPQSQETRSPDVYRALEQKLPPDLDVLAPSPAQDADVLTVTGRTAASGVHSLQDLGARCGSLVLGAPAEWKSRWVPKIEQLYGCRFRDIRSVEAGTVTTKALTSGQVQVADMFTTSASIREHGLVELADPKGMFPAQNVVPLVGKGRLRPEQIAALDRVNRALTTDELTELDRRLDVDKDNPADLAKEFVHNAGL
jgi:osmoprotectant transport system substrate-binding protein